jgi:hypothetical protein
VAHAGRTVARSLAVPGGKRRASRMRIPYEATSTAAAMSKSLIIGGQSIYDGCASSPTVRGA